MNRKGRRGIILSAAALSLVMLAFVLSPVLMPSPANIIENNGIKPLTTAVTLVTSLPEKLPTTTEVVQKGGIANYSCAKLIELEQNYSNTMNRLAVSLYHNWIIRKNCTVGT